jgi:dienelactone hydrolase
VVKLKDFLHVDLLSSAGALGWAMGAQFVSEMANLVDYRAAFAFAGVAFVRWMTNIRKRAT